MARRRSRQDGSVEFLESLRCTLVAGQALKKCPEVRAEPARTLPTVVEGSEDGVVVGVPFSSGRHPGQESVSEREPGPMDGPEPGRSMDPAFAGGTGRGKGAAPAQTGSRTGMPCRLDWKRPRLNSRHQ